MDSGNGKSPSYKYPVQFVPFNRQVLLNRTCLKRSDLQFGHTRHNRLHVFESSASPCVERFAVQQYWCPVMKAFTDPPRPKLASRLKGAKLHRLFDGSALCGTRKPRWFALSDEIPTCKGCLSQMTQFQLQGLKVYDV